MATEPRQNAKALTQGKGCSDEAQPAGNLLNQFTNAAGEQLDPVSWSQDQICQFFTANGSEKFAKGLAAEGDFKWTDIKCALGYNTQTKDWSHDKPKNLEDWGLSGRNWRGVQELMRKLEPGYMTYDDIKVEDGARQQIMYFQRSVDREVVDICNDIFTWEGAHEVTAVEVCKGIKGCHFDRVMTATLKPLGIVPGQERKDKNGMLVNRLDSILASKFTRIKGSFVLDQAYNMHKDGKGHASYFVFYLSRDGEPNPEVEQERSVDDCTFDVSVVAYQCQYTMKPMKVERVTKTSRWGFLFEILMGENVGGRFTTTTMEKEWKALSDEERNTLECFFKTRALSQWKSSGFLQDGDFDKFKGKTLT